MPEGVGFPFPSLLFHEGRTYGQPEVVPISLPQVATGLRSRLPGSFRRRGFQPDLLMPQEALFARGAHSMQAVMHRAFRQIPFSFWEKVTCRKSKSDTAERGKRIMAIFHYTVKIVGRSKGKSIISASAYLNGDVMKNEETGRISYYTSKREVVYTSLLMCENAPQEWLNVPAENIRRFQKSVRYKRADNKDAALEKFKLTFQKQRLWNEVLKIEKTSDAQLGRSFEFSLPKEWSRQEQIDYTLQIELQGISLSLAVPYLLKNEIEFRQVRIFKKIIPCSIKKYVGIFVVQLEISLEILRGEDYLSKADSFATFTIGIGFLLGIKITINSLVYLISFSSPNFE